MPFFDKFWWLHGIFAAGWLGIAGWLLAVQHGHGDYTPLDSLVNTLPFLLLATLFALLMVRGWRRYRVRQRALHGDVDAMPLAAFQTHPERALPLDALPLPLLWEPKPRARAFAWLRLALIALLSCSLVAFDGLLLFTLNSPTTDDPSTRVFIMVIIALVVLYIAVIGVVAIIRQLPTALGTVTGVSATKEGIGARTEWRGWVTIPWSEVRLVEYSRNLANRRAFTVYSASQVIRWRDYAGVRVVNMFGKAVIRSAARLVDPVDVPLGETERRQTEILDVLAANTGQRIRSESPALQATPATSPMRGMVVLALLGAISGVVVGIMTVVLPFTDVGILNWLALLVMAIYAYMMSRGAWMFSTLMGRAGADPLSPPGAVPDFVTGEEVYVLRWRVSSRDWQTRTAFLAALMLGGFLGVVAIIRAMSEGNHDLFIGRRLISIFIAIVFVGVGLIGARLYLGAISPSARIVEFRATSVGLAGGGGGGTSFQVAWSSVGSLATTPMKGPKRGAYMLRASDGIRFLRWWFAPEDVLEAPSGATQVSPEELAALVERQTGLTFHPKEPA